MAKPKGLRDIIGDAIESERPAKKTLPKKLRPAPNPSVRRPRPPFDREEAILPRRPRNSQKPSAPSRRQMPKRKPKDVRPRKSAGNY